MRTLIVSAAITMIALLGVATSAEAQFNGYRSIDPMGIDRPPAPVPNTRRGKRRVYEPIEGNYPPCTGFKWVGDRCRLPTGQVCMVFDFGLGSCV